MKKGGRLQVSYCSCGVSVRGNGAKHSHRAMHKRRGDPHRWVVREKFERIDVALPKAKP